MQQYQRPLAAGTAEVQTLQNALIRLAASVRRVRAQVQHVPVPAFEPVSPISIRLTASPAVTSVRLWYRHVDQAERWVSLEMVQNSFAFEGSIPAQYTNSPFSIQYYFAVTQDSQVQLHPAFGEDFCGQPYFVIEQR